MKTTIPLLIVAVTGCLMIAAKFIPPLSVWKNEAGGWFDMRPIVPAPGLGQVVVSA